MYIIRVPLNRLIYSVIFGFLQLVFLMDCSYPFPMRNVPIFNDVTFTYIIYKYLNFYHDHANVFLR